MVVNKFLKAVLKTAACAMDQYSTQLDRASDRVAGLVDRGKEMVQPEDHGLRNALSFAAGMSLGIGAALLFAPASGKEVRSSIKEKVHEMRAQAR
jgi:hypothetical protein